VDVFDMVGTKDGFKGNVVFDSSMLLDWMLLSSLGLNADFVEYKTSACWLFETTGLLRILHYLLLIVV
jgi:hypothetical protein